MAKQFFVNFFLIENLEDVDFPVNLRRKCRLPEKSYFSYISQFQNEEFPKS